MLSEKDVIRAHARDELGIGEGGVRAHAGSCRQRDGVLRGVLAHQAARPCAQPTPRQFPLAHMAPPGMRLSCSPPTRPRTPRTHSHTRPADIDELANPLQAAVVSAICFTVGAALPLLSAAWVRDANIRLGILAGATTGEHGLAVGHWCRVWLLVRKAGAAGHAKSLRRAAGSLSRLSRMDGPALLLASCLSLPVLALLLQEPCGCRTLQWAVAGHAPHAAAARPNIRGADAAFASPRPALQSASAFSASWAHGWAALACSAAACAWCWAAGSRWALSTALAARSMLIPPHNDQ